MCIYNGRRMYTGGTRVNMVDCAPLPATTQYNWLLFGRRFFLLARHFQFQRRANIFTRNHFMDFVFLLIYMNFLHPDDLWLYRWAYFWVELFVHASCMSFVPRAPQQYYGRSVTLLRTMIADWFTKKMEINSYGLLHKYKYWSKKSPEYSDFSFLKYIISLGFQLIAGRRVM